MNEVVFDPVIALPWIAALGALLFAATIYVYQTVAARLSLPRRLLLLGCRLVALALLLLVLLQPSRREAIPERKIRKVLLVGIDASRSMNQRDAAGRTRIDAAREAAEAVAKQGGDASQLEIRFFQFGTDAAPLAAEGIGLLQGSGTSTRIHPVVDTMLNSVSSEESAAALVLLTDGHDFDLTSAARTAAMARGRRVPIYAVPFGDHGYVRDASLYLTNFAPYSYINQTTRISANLRLIGCEHEELTVQLLRKGEVVKTLRINAGDKTELPVDFEVSEPKIGQYEYEVRLSPVRKESDEANNSAITYVNAIDQRIRVLLLEGAPYWDTTFLSRSLFRNDKIDLDAILQYMPGKARRIRKADEESKPPAEELQIPTTQEEWNRYDVVILGKEAEKLLDPAQVQLLVSFVKDRGGAVIFSRGEALSSGAKGLEPVIWTDTANEQVHLRVTREGRSVPPFRILDRAADQEDAATALIGARQILQRQTLASLLAVAHDTDLGKDAPGVAHRRFGRGQTVSIAVEGLWRLAFNAKADSANNLFDRFWDQFLVWLVANTEVAPEGAFSFRVDSGNVPLGNKLQLRLIGRDATKPLKETPFTLYHGETLIGRSTLAADPNTPTRLTAEFEPEKVGRYRAVVNLPDGSSQEVKWIVFDENLEEKEVATDVGYLKALSEESGGKLLSADEFTQLAARLQSPEDEEQNKIRLKSLWDRVWFFYMIGAFLGMDWYWRRKWGLC